MSERFPGGIISYTPPTLNPALGSAAPGIWTLDQVTQAVKAGTWPPYDPYYPYVTLNLHGNGTNGAQNNTFLDSSTNNFTITRNGNTTQGTFTPYGSNWSNYFSYNATAANYLTSNSLSLSGDFTIEGYVYWDGVGSLPNMFTLGDSFTSTGIEVYLGGGTNWVVYSNNATRITGAAGVKCQWTYIAVTRSGSTVTMYINGVSQGTWTSSATFSGTIRVGAEFYNGTYYSSMSGYISNFRVNNTTAINQVPTTPLTAVSGTIFLTCQSNRFIDNSSNGYTITVNGSPSVQRFSPFSPSAAYSTSVVGGSGYFDGSGDSLTAATNTNLNLGSGDFTVECWFYQLSAKVTSCISQNSVNSNGYAIGASTTANKVWWYAGGTTQILSSATFAYNTWNHLAAVRSGGTTTLYLNGASVGSFSDSANYSGTTTYIGSDEFAQDWNGYIAGARIVKGTAVYTGAFTPPTAPPTAVTNTQLLLNMTNGGIIDNAMMNDLETVGNAQISTSVVKYGTGSLYFDGSGDWLAAQSSPLWTLGSTGDFTIEGWLYSVTTQSAFAVVVTNCYDENNSAGYNNRFNVLIRLGNVLSWRNDAGSTSISTTISHGVWMHFAFVRSGSTITGYLNGTSFGTTSSSQAYTATGTTLLVGGGVNGGSSLNGYIDDLRITKGYARYTANFTPQTSQWQDQ